MIEVSTIVANKAREVGAVDWLADLNGVVAGLAADWDLGVGDPLTGGTEAYVTEVTRADGSPAVLKIMIPRPDADPWARRLLLTNRRCSDLPAVTVVPSCMRAMSPAVRC